ncbi:glycosyl hydrolase [Patescibacteria group bacterium]|nr:glycosyl hydrolase [Patescibacteria group bacterium]MCL5114602.1 glycosyl hydrolase [Patescibacteria group bacterium]
MNRLVFMLLVATLAGCKPPDAPSPNPNPNPPDSPTFASEYESWPFGATTCLATRYQGSDTALIGTAIAKMADAGIRWQRESFEWTVLEPKKNQFNWSPFDKAVNGELKAKINVLGMLCYGASWWGAANNHKDMSSLTDTMLAEWSSYVETVVGRYKNQIHYWEIWSEEDFSMFWHPTPNANDYVRLLRASYEAIMSVAPESHILMGGVVGTDTSFVSQVYAAGGSSYFDILAVDLYPGVAPDITVRGDTTYPSMLVGQIAGFHDLFPDKPLWITEIGWTTGVSYVSESQQADYLVRAYVQLLALPEVQKVFWYDFRDDGTGDPYEDNFGLVHRDRALSSKEDYDAYQTLTGILGGATFESNSFGNGIFEYRFSGNQKTIDAIWTTANTPQTVTVGNIAGSSATLTTLTGSSQTVTVQNGQCTVTASQSPVYLVH